MRTNERRDCAMQEEDEAIAQVFYWAGTADEMSDMPSLGTKLIPKEQAIQYGPEALAYWSRWDDLSIWEGILYKKWFQRDGSKPTLLTVVPAAGREDILGQFDSIETIGGQLATEKMLAKIRRRYWWPTMRTDVKKSPVVLKPSSTESQWEKEASCGSGPI